MKTQLRNK